MGPNTPLILPNGVKLTYGQIMALADFFGVPGSPIVNPASLHGDSKDGEKDEGRRERFLAAYGSLALKPKEEVMKVLNKLLKMMQQENNVMAKGNGKLYTDADWDRATGGIWAGNFIISLFEYL